MQVVPKINTTTVPVLNIGESADAFAVLKLTADNLSEKLISLKQDQTFRVGRTEGNDLVLDDVKVSRFHSVLNVTPDGVLVSDLGSLNGTYLNTRRILAPTPIKTGDVIAIGDAQLRVEFVATDAPTRGERVAETQAASLRSVVATVLVADVCGFTPMSESLPGQDVARMLQRWFARVTEIVQEQGGEVNKYIGDAVMAIWHSAAGQATDRAERAITAAKKILEVSKQLSLEPGWSHHERYPWQCRVCLNSGEALMGSLGSSTGREITVLGDSINVAFRLEGVAKVLNHHLVVSASTAELIKSCCEVERLGLTAVKGRMEQVDVYLVKN